MPRFAYKAKKSPDEAMEGFIDADSEKAVINKLNRSGYYLVWIKEETAQKELNRIKVKTKDLANFTRRVSELLNSGLTLYNALNVIERQTEKNNLRGVIKAIAESIKDGKSFSGALRNYPNVFSELYVNLARSGEESGSLNEALANISDFLDKEEDAKSRVIAALAYPGLMAIVGLATVVILVIFIVPRLVNMFIEMGEDLPLPTRILAGTGSFIRAYWIWLLSFAGVTALVFKRNKANPVIKDKIDRFKLKVPIIGNFVRNSELARFSAVLSTLLKNGVPILDSLNIVSGVVTNNAIKGDISLIHDDIKLGLSFSKAIKKRKYFPLFLADMASAGEEGGFLDKALLNIARNYEIEMERAMKIIMSLLEPVFILIMGLVVGFIVLAMLLPVFQISLTAR